eukprot:gene11506-biopygen2147
MRGGARAAAPQRTRGGQAAFPCTLLLARVPAAAHSEPHAAPRGGDPGPPPAGQSRWRLALLAAGAGLPRKSRGSEELQGPRPW